MLTVYEELADASRRQILGELRTGPKNVTQLVSATSLKQPNVSNHLSRMRSKGIVKATKVGREVYYTLGSPEIEDVVRQAFAEEPRAAKTIDLSKFVRDYSKSAIQGDDVNCAEIVDRANRHNVQVLDLFDKLLAPALYTIGDWYEKGIVDEAQEHLATGITERMLARALHSKAVARKTDRMALLGCVEGNLHNLGLRMVADYLKLGGWRVFYLGADVPTEAFLKATAGHEPDIVLLSYSDTSLPQCLDLVQKLVDERLRQRPFLLGVGGLQAIRDSGALRDAGADFVASNLREFAEQILPQIENGQFAKNVRMI